MLNRFKRKSASNRTPYWKNVLPALNGFVGFFLRFFHRHGSHNERTVIKNEYPRSESGKYYKNFCDFSMQMKVFNFLRIFFFLKRNSKVIEENILVHLWFVLNISKWEQRLQIHSKQFVLNEMHFLKKALKCLGFVMIRLACNTNTQFHLKNLRTFVSNWKCRQFYPIFSLNSNYLYLKKNGFLLQSFIWPLARPATSDENVIVELRSQTTKNLLKAGLASTSNSRGTIASNSKIVGRYVMLMQGKQTCTFFILFHLVSKICKNQDFVDGKLIHFHPMKMQ